METVLKSEKISVEFGGLKAVTNFDIEIKQGELIGLIGPNGAGKTTIFNLLTGVYKPTSGRIFLGDKNITGMRPNKIVDEGMARTFQNIRLFKKMTVLDNVKVSFNHKMKYNVLSGIFRLPAFWREENKVEEKALELLKVFEMDGMADTIAENLPYGKQRKLEIARALASDPKLLLLDEPAAGMNPTETVELMETIALIRKRFNVSVLLIEHDMSLVMGICERVIVLNYGEIIAQGLPLVV
ncbi:MAG: ABC transporter ATP-binding protein, partial [Oscillospiraceae bacterium]